jgi:amidohydrolase
MAFMMADIPGCYFFIGSADHERGLDAGHHHPKFDFNEESLTTGAALMASVVLEFLK